MSKETESCGRCGISSVVDTAEDGADPFGGDRIEVRDAEARAVSPAAWLGGLKRRVDAAAARLIEGR